MTKNPEKYAFLINKFGLNENSINLEVVENLIAETRKRFTSSEIDKNIAKKELKELEHISNTLKIKDLENRNYQALAEETEISSAILRVLGGIAARFGLIFVAFCVCVYFVWSVQYATAHSNDTGVSDRDSDLISGFNSFWINAYYSSVIFCKYIYDITKSHTDGNLVAIFSGLASLSIALAVYFRESSRNSSNPVSRDKMQERSDTKSIPWAHQNYYTDNLGNIGESTVSLTVDRILVWFTIVLSTILCIALFVGGQPVVGFFGILLTLYLVVNDSRFATKISLNKKLRKSFLKDVANSKYEIRISRKKLSRKAMVSAYWAWWVAVVADLALVGTKTSLEKGFDDPKWEMGVFTLILLFCIIQVISESIVHGSIHRLMHANFILGTCSLIVTIVIFLGLFISVAEGWATEGEFVLQGQEALAQFGIICLFALLFLRFLGNFGIGLLSIVYFLEFENSQDAKSKSAFSWKYSRKSAIWIVFICGALSLFNFVMVGTHGGNHWSIGGLLAMFIMNLVLVFLGVLSVAKKFGLFDAAFIVYAVGLNCFFLNRWQSSGDSVWSLDFLFCGAYIIFTLGIVGILEYIILKKSGNVKVMIESLGKKK